MILQATATTQSSSVVDGVPVGLDGHVLCPLDVPDRSGQTVFATICKDGHYELMKELLRHSCRY